MTGKLKLLVSVRSAAEAEAAIAGGADWVDLKEPQRGALGAVDVEIAREVVACVAGRAPVSAAAGELVDWPSTRAKELLTVDGLSLLKLGLSGCRGLSWEDPWHAARRAIESAGKSLAAVIYADEAAASSPECTEVLQAAGRWRCPWILMDTFDKNSGSIGRHAGPAELATALRGARAANQKTVVAGRLDAEAIAMLPLEFVDMIAVRGAACDSGRNGIVRRERVAELRALLTRLEDADARQNGLFPGVKEFA